MSDDGRSAALVSALFCPADRPDRFLKAAGSGAELVLVDLEDGVAPNQKERARDDLLRLLGQPATVPLCPRINAAGSPWFADDIAALAGVSGLNQVMLPKVQSPDDIAEVRTAMPRVGIRVLVETAAGVTRMTSIAAAAGVLSAGLGEADLASDLGITDPAVLDPIRMSLVVACRAAGLPPPMMSVYAHFADDEGLRAACRRARTQGFVGAQIIHPRQLPVVVEAFTPATEEVDSAEQVLAALAVAGRAGAGVAVLASGAMVDAAMGRSAELTLQLASRLR